ncbi:MAG TPA: hypothetical protein P5218_16680, partial [Planctomycetota bacterium]|nr:hypothetical protein [Planctomycetota bacterium]
MKLLSLVIWATLGLFIDASHAAPLQKGTDYAADIEFALDALEERCGHFFDQKGVQWKKVRSEFTKAAKAVTSDEAHFELLVRLLARLRDGHARVQPTEANADFVYPKDLFPEVEGPGLFWCRVGKRYYVRNAMGNGAELGFRPGMEILKVNGTKVDAWVKKRQAELSELIS